MNLDSLEVDGFYAINAPPFDLLASSCVNNQIRPEFFDFYVRVPARDVDGPHIFPRPSIEVLLCWVFCSHTCFSVSFSVEV